MIAYLPTVPAVIVILTILIVFPICQVIFIIVRHQVSQGKTIMSANKVDTVPWSPSSVLRSKPKEGGNMVIL